MDPVEIFDAVERTRSRALRRDCAGRRRRRRRRDGAHERAWGVPVETTFRIASITKPIVAAAALGLVEQGLLALDDPLDGLRLPWDGITLRQLLSHQAGLAHDWARPLADYGEGDDALQRLAADEAVGGPVGPGRYFAYSNPGYWLTGALIERAAEMPFEDALRVLVLEPLGMERTGFSPIEPSVPNDMPYPRARRPSGGLYSCAFDVLRFAQHLRGSESLREMQTPQIEVGPDGDYGLGLGIVRGRGRLTIEHGGAVPGARAQLLLVPGQDSRVRAAHRLGPGALPDRSAPARRGARAGVCHPRSPFRTRTSRRLPARSASRSGLSIQVTPRDGGIELAVVGEATAHLRPASATRFVVREGEDKGDWAEFFEGGRLMRYDTLFERVG